MTTFARNYTAPVAVKHTSVWLARNFSLAGSVRDTTKPTISNLNPAEGTTLAAEDSIEFDVTDETGLRAVVILASFADSDRYEVVYDGDDFAPLYGGASTAEEISGGYHFTVARTGGWPGAVTFKPIAIDTSGNENV